MDLENLPITSGSLSPIIHISPFAINEYPNLHIGVLDFNSYFQYKSFFDVYILCNTTITWSTVNTDPTFTPAALF